MQKATDINGVSKSTHSIDHLLKNCVKLVATYTSCHAVYMQVSAAGCSINTESVDLYRHWNSVNFNTLSVDLTLDNVLCITAVVYIYVPRCPDRVVITCACRSIPRYFPGWISVPN